MEAGTAERARLLAEQVRALAPETVRRPTLVYFDIVGICWPIRCLLHLKGVDYDLIQISLREWMQPAPQGGPLLPASFRNGHVPLYVDTDVSLGQSNVIMSYLGEKHDLIGDKPTERLAAMEVMAHAYDALFHWTGLFAVNIRMSTPDDVVQSRLQAFLGKGNWGVTSNGYRRNLDAFERYLDANPDQDSGFIVGSRLSVADLYAFNVLCNWYKAFDPDLFTATYPSLDDYIGRIGAIPEVREYIRDHQEPTVWFPLPQFALRLTSPEELIRVAPPVP